jgi:heme exporter protein B
MKALSQAGLIRWLVWRDVTLAWRRRSDLTGALLFFVLVATLFPLSVGSDPRLLRSIAPGIVWVAALLASMLCLGRLFADDYLDGTLDQLALSPQPIYAMVLAKVFAQWLVAVLPLLIVAPLLVVQFGLPPAPAMVLAVSLALGTPVVLLVGSIGAALTLGLRGANTLTSLLVMPLYIPTLVFGCGAVQSTLSGMQAGAEVRLLGATFVLALVLAPWAAAAAVRISLE